MGRKKTRGFPITPCYATLRRVTRCMKTTGDESDLTCEIQNGVDKYTFTPAPSQLHKLGKLNQIRYYVNFPFKDLLRNGQNSTEP